MRPLTSICRIVALFGLALMAVSGPAVAGGLQVSPTKFHLSAKTKTGLLTLSNDGTEETRIQATAYRWTQSATGEIVLAATTDLVVYPSLFTLAPGKARSVRIGVAGAVGKTELGYRLILEELPPLQRPADETVKIRMLTRLSIPVFVRPAKLVTTSEIRDVALDAGHASFEVANTGTTYVIVDHARVVGRDETGAIILDRTLRGWYVLAGDNWKVDLALDAELCGRLTRLEIEATVGERTSVGALDVAGKTCAR